jgi:serine/threonine protein kinase
MARTAIESPVPSLVAISDDPVRRTIDRRIPWAIHGEVYSQQHFGTGPARDQGWKLHVAATPLSAVDVLEAALDVLLGEGVRFKVTSSLALLSALNAGDFGLSQIGKFIAVYPSDDVEAVGLALELAEATRDRRGPRIPSDRPLRPDSLVHYRYGSMRPRPEEHDSGDAAFGAYDLLDTAGRLTSDVRLGFYLAPPGIDDPFEAAGAYVPRPARDKLLNGRYLVVDALSQSPRGGVFRAVDLEALPARLCLVKESLHDVCVDQYGRDARLWAANEERILCRYAGDPSLPCLFDSFERDRNRYIAIEYIEGTPLDRLLSDEHSTATGVGLSDVIAIGLATADELSHLHEIGLLFRDFKPANVIKTPDAAYRLIDFGIAYEYAEHTRPALGVGTPPFCSPGQFDAEDPVPADDVFAWGAVLHYMACGETSLADMPQDGNGQRPFRRRPVSELNPGVPPLLAAVIDRAVAWERAERYATMAEARNELAKAAHTIKDKSVRALSGDNPANPQPDAPVPVRITCAAALHLACEVGNALCTAAEQRGGGLCWATPIGFSKRLQRSPDLYSGAAGIGLFLAELAHATGETRYAEAARGAARWLMGPAWGRGWAQHGLHGGEPGVAHFFVRVAALLDEPCFVTAAELRMRRLRDAPPTTVDVMHGTAGTILTLLRVYAATGDSAYLSDARIAGDALVRASLPAPHSTAGRYWEVASAEPGGATAPYLGLLHGAAGIGLALAQLAAATGEEHYLRAAVGAAELLLAQAHRSRPGAPGSALAGGDALAWPRQIGDEQSGVQALCHGAGGIAQFFVRLHHIAPDPRYRKAAEAAAHTIAARCEHAHYSCVCHGLSGTGHVLLDCHQALGGPDWLALARECGGGLQRFGEGEQSGVYSTNIAGPVSHDLMLGSAGVGSFLLRLANPDTASEPILC